MPYTKTPYNQFIPRDKHDAYDNAPPRGHAEGSQLVGCASSHAMVKRLECNPKDAVLYMTDNTAPRLLIPRLHQVMPNLRADYNFTISSDTPTPEDFHPCQWPDFLLLVDGITIQGNFDVKLLSNVLLGLPEHAAMVACSLTRPIQMPIQQFYQMLPSDVRQLT